MGRRFRRLSSPLGPRLRHRRHRWRRRLLRDAAGADAVRLSPAHRQRLRLLIETPFVQSRKSRPPSGRGFLCNAPPFCLSRKHDLTQTLPMVQNHPNKRSSEGSLMLDRRDLMKRAGLTALVTGLASAKALALDTATLPFDNGERPLVRYRQKRPMIGLTSRPPQLETPFSIFNDGAITPNNAFFVRYHLAGVPLDIDPDKFTLEIKGKIDHPLKLSLKEIKKLRAVELIAVNQCSGNSRGFFEPRVAGGQLGNGAMGNARWRGVPLKTVLDIAGVQQGAKQVTFNGMDGPAMDTTPDFVKALDIDHARDGEVMLAYRMNGDDLPLLNGFPLRLVVPGYYGTYWVKHLNEITVIDNIFDGFWMKSVYRLSDTHNTSVEAG